VLFEGDGLDTALLIVQLIAHSRADLRDAHFQKQDVFASNSKPAEAQAYDELIRKLFDV
jgi:hypothetical protein